MESEKQAWQTNGMVESLSGTSRPCQGIKNDTGLTAVAFTPGRGDSFYSSVYL